MGRKIGFETPTAEVDPLPGSTRSSSKWKIIHKIHERELPFYEWEAKAHELDAEAHGIFVQQCQ